MSSPEAVARRLYTALEGGTHGEELRALFTADATTVEHPNLIVPGGASIMLEQMLTSSTAGVGMLAEQRYHVIDVIEHGDTAIVRLTWTAVVARDRGPFAAGQALTAHIAQFVTVSGTRVSNIETFDCYEPFA